MRAPSRNVLLPCVLLAAAVAALLFWRETREAPAPPSKPRHVGEHEPDPSEIVDFTLKRRTSFLDAPENAGLFVSAGAEEEARAAAAGMKAPPRVAFVGFDGMSWDVLIPLMREGKAPNLESLARRGVAGSLSTLHPTRSPAIWTSMATGVRPERHGILHFQKVVGGKRTADISTSRDRRVRALWNVLSETGRRSFLVNYYNTYPAEPIEGMVITNFLRHAQMLARFRVNQTTLDALAREAMVRPSSALDRVLALLPSDEEIARAAESLMGAGETEGAGEKRGYDYVRFFVEMDLAMGRMALEFYPEERPDFATVFFQGADVVQHYYQFHHWERHASDKKARRALRKKNPHAYDRQAALVPRYGDAVRDYYQRLDAWLGEFLEAVGPDAVVMVVSDHGLDALPRFGERTGGHLTAPAGIFLMVGPGVRAGERLADATVYDIGPTLMAAMGMPVARDLDGRVLEGVFCGEFLQKFPVAYVNTYETSPREIPADAPMPPEAKEEYEKELKSLGYIR